MPAGLISTSGANEGANYSKMDFPPQANSFKSELNYNEANYSSCFIILLNGQIIRRVLSTWNFIQAWRFVPFYYSPIKIPENGVSSRRSNREDTDPILIKKTPVTRSGLGRST